MIKKVLSSGSYKHKADKISFRLNTSAAKKFLDDLEKIKDQHPVFYQPNNEIELFGKRISMGECAMVIVNFEPNRSTLNRLESISKTEDNTILMEFVPQNNATIIYYYKKWCDKSVTIFDQFSQG